MRKTILALAILALVPAGCATGFRAGGPRGGCVSAGAAVGSPVVAERPTYLPPAETPPPPAIR